MKEGDARPDHRFVAHHGSLYGNIRMILVRYCKIALVASVALYATFVVFNNVTDYGLNFAFEDLGADQRIGISKGVVNGGYVGNMSWAGLGGNCSVWKRSARGWKWRPSGSVGTLESAAGALRVRRCRARGLDWEAGRSGVAYELTR